MIPSDGAGHAEFYRLRDRRTNEYLELEWRPIRSVRVDITAAAARSKVGQHLLLSLTNLLARIHRQIIFTLPADSIPLRVFSVSPAQTLQEATLGLARAIDPCGNFETGCSGGDFTLGIGPDAAAGLDWYLGSDRAVGYLNREPAVLEEHAPGSLRGAGMASILGAAAALKAELGLPVVERTVSAWNYLEGEEADFGPVDLAPVSVGRVLVVGAGAVAAGLTYWLRSWGVEGQWLIVDRDTVALHNTNRGMLFLPDDAGWPTGRERPKADVLAGVLPEARAVLEWYNDATELLDEKFDVILALANERGIREQLSHRNATVSLHATTGQNWLSQLHRHVAGRDDCIDCRISDLKEVAFECSTARISTEHVAKTDAALPFLSAASGLMLTTLLQHLQDGTLTSFTANNWRWDFLSNHLLAAPPGRSRCRTGCSSWYPPDARAKANDGTMWSHLDGALESGVAR